LILNAIFIFGLLGMPRMGANGAALTTVLSKGLELVIVVVDSYQKGNLRPSFKQILSINPEIEKEFWKYSFHILLDYMIWGIGITMYSVIIGHLGSDATAANSVASIVKDLLTCLCRGMSTGGGILIGNVLGAGDLKLAKEYGNKLAHLSLVCGLISGALVVFVAPPIFAFMQLTDTARGYLGNMLLILAVYMFGKSICVIVVTGIFNAGGDTKFDAYSVAVTMWGIIIPLAALSAFVWKLPVLVVYFIISMDEVIKLPWVYHHYKRYIWVKDITRDDL
jgi:Na+-driven multidrug efflux pump